MPRPAATSSNSTDARCRERSIAFGFQTNAGERFRLPCGIGVRNRWRVFQARPLRNRSQLAQGTHRGWFDDSLERRYPPLGRRRPLVGFHREKTEIGENRRRKRRSNNDSETSGFHHFDVRCSTLRSAPFAFSAASIPHGSILQVAPARARPSLSRRLSRSFGTVALSRSSLDTRRASKSLERTEAIHRPNVTFRSTRTSDSNRKGNRHGSSTGRGVDVAGDARSMG